MYHRDKQAPPHQLCALALPAMRHPTGVEQHTCSSSNDSLSRLVPERKPTRQNQLAGESGGLSPRLGYTWDKSSQMVYCYEVRLYMRGGDYIGGKMTVAFPCLEYVPSLLHCFPPSLLRLLFFTDRVLLSMQRRSYNSKINIKHCICSVREGTTDNATPHPSSTMEGEEGRGTLGTTLSQPPTYTAHISCRCYLAPRSNAIRSTLDLQQPLLNM
ncbi:hypothetical protein V8C44DRAFT_47040 [Trichoderma aethiopicum]